MEHQSINYTIANYFSFQNLPNSEPVPRHVSVSSNDDRVDDDDEYATTESDFSDEEEQEDPSDYCRGWYKYLICVHILIDAVLAIDRTLGYIIATHHLHHLSIILLQVVTTQYNLVISTTTVTVSFANWAGDISQQFGWLETASK